MPTNIKKKAPMGALERIEALEHTCQALVQSLNQLINQANARLNATAETINALAAEIGEEKVEARIQQMRDEAEAQQLAAAEKFIKDSVAAGTLVAAESMTQSSLVVGVEYDAEGKAVKPGRIQVNFNQILPELQKDLLGKTPGSRVETKGGTTFEILEIYERATPAPKTPDEVIAAVGEAEQAEEDVVEAEIVEDVPSFAGAGAEAEADQLAREALAKATAEVNKQG